MKQIAIFASMLMLVIACGNGSGDNDANKVSNNIEVYKKSQNETRPIVEIYFLITEALVAGDADFANDASAELQNVLQEEEFERYTEIKNLVNKFRDARTIDDKRVIYSTLSNEIYQLIKNGGLPKGELYLMHCPMAFDNKGASWISYRKEVLNPYFGDEMLNCGSIIEEL